MSDPKAATPIAFPAPTVCWPWHLRFCGPDDYAAELICADCRRDVAGPNGARRPICLYCGMERGIVPLAEIAPGGDRSPFPWCGPEWTISLDDLAEALDLAP